MTLITDAIVRSVTNDVQLEPRKKILVTGGAGFIGSNFVRFLYHHHPEYKIVNFDALTYSGNLENLKDISDDTLRYTFIQGNICDKNLLNYIIATFQFDCIVNFAAESHVDRSLNSSEDFMKTNIIGTHTLIEACKKNHVPRYVHISTDEVYGDIEQGESDETSVLRPSSPYSSSKASADLLITSYIRSFDLPAVIIRGSNNFGPYQYPEKLVPLIISNLLENISIPIHGNGQHIRSWIYVEDFCRAIDMVMHTGRRGEIYNVSGVAKTNLEIISSIANILNLNNSYQTLLQHTNDRPGADLRYAPNSQKISKELGWFPQHTFEDALLQTVTWYQTQSAWWQPIKKMPVFLEHYEKQKKAQYY